MQSGINPSGDAAARYTLIELIVVMAIISILVVDCRTAVSKSIVRRQGELAQEQSLHAAHGDRRVYLR